MTGPTVTVCRLSMETLSMAGASQPFQVGLLRTAVFTSLFIPGVAWPAVLAACLNGQVGGVGPAGQAPTFVQAIGQPSDAVSVRIRRTKRRRLAIAGPFKKGKFAEQPISEPQQIVRICTRGADRMKLERGAHLAPSPAHQTSNGIAP